MGSRGSYKFYGRVENAGVVVKSLKNEERL